MNSGWNVLVPFIYKQLSECDSLALNKKVLTGLFEALPSEHPERLFVSTSLAHLEAHEKLQMRFCKLEEGK